MQTLATPRNTLAAVFAAIVLAMAAMAPTANAAVPSDFIGVVAEDVFAGDAAYRATNLSTQRRLKIGLTRQTFDWARIETAPGVYDFSVYDRYVADLSTHGMAILPILFNPPAFRSSAPPVGAKRGTYPPKRFADIGDFGAVLVKRYGPAGSFWAENPSVPRMPIRAWQIWNEPNLGAYWPTGPNPKQYVALLKAAAQGIKAADRSAEIVTAGLPQSKIGMALEKYVTGMYKAGGKKWFDTLAVNPYARTTKELMSRLKMVRAVMAKGKDKKARLWITEIGWASQGPASPFRVGPKRHADNVKSSMRGLMKARKTFNLRGVVYFNWKDAPPYAGGSDFWGLHTGLLAIDGTPKPALSALEAAVAGL